MTGEFAQIVGLISAFASSRTAQEALDYSKFLVWLTEKNHSELRAKIEQNQATTVSIEALLNGENIHVQQKLDFISEQMAILLSRSGVFSDLAQAYSLQLLSDQAWEILSLMDEHNSESFMLTSFHGPDAQEVAMSSGPDYSCPEPHFLPSDLALLVDLGLLLMDYSSSGNPLYYFTRAASDLVRGGRPSATPSI